MLRDHRGRWERRVRSCTKERSAVYVLVVQRGPRGAGVARVALRAQQYCSCVMIVSPSGLWVRARAGAWVLAVCEDRRADGDATEDGDVD